MATAAAGGVEEGPFLSPAAFASPWLDAVCAVTFDVDFGQKLDACFPRDALLSDAEAKQVASLALPEGAALSWKFESPEMRIAASRRGATSGTAAAAAAATVSTTPGGDEISVYFAFRYRKNASGVPLYSASPQQHSFRHGFVCFRRYKDESAKRGFAQRSLVVLTRLPLYTFYQRFLAVLADAYFASSIGGLGLGNEAIKACILDVSRWPVPEPRQLLELPLLGCALRLTVPETGMGSRSGLARWLRENRHKGPLADGDHAVAEGGNRLGSLSAPPSEKQLRHGKVKTKSESYEGGMAAGEEESQKNAIAVNDPRRRQSSGGSEQSAEGASSSECSTSSSGVQSESSFSGVSVQSAPESGAERPRSVMANVRFASDSGLPTNQVSLRTEPLVAEIMVGTAPESSDTPAQKQKSQHTQLQSAAAKGQQKKSAKQPPKSLGRASPPRLPGTLVGSKAPSLSEMFAAKNESGVGLFQSIGLYSSFGESLTPHLWTMWEAALVGDPILILSPSPSTCAQLVEATVSLIAPVPYAGDYRPYITVFDPDFKEMCARHTKNKGLGLPSTIVGTTNPYIVKMLQFWPTFVHALPSLHGKALRAGRDGAVAVVPTGSALLSSSSSSSMPMIPLTFRSSAPGDVKLKRVRITVPLETALGNKLEQGTLQPAIVARRDPVTKANGQVLRQLVHIGDSVVSRELSRMGSGSVSGDDNARDASGSALASSRPGLDFCSGFLLPGGSEGPSEVTINDAILRQHFQRLTAEFLAPFERYFAVSGEVSDGGYSNGLSVNGSGSCGGANVSLSARAAVRNSKTGGGGGVTSLGPYADLKKVLEKFDETTFLHRLARTGASSKPLLAAVLPTASARESLYRRFVRSPSFRPWFNERRKRTLRMVDKLLRGVRSVVTSAELIRACGNKKGKLGPREVARLLGLELRIQNEIQREATREDSAADGDNRVDSRLLTHMRGHLAAVRSVVQQYERARAQLQADKAAGKASNPNAARRPKIVIPKAAK